MWLSDTIMRSAYAMVSYSAIVNVRLRRHHEIILKFFLESIWATNFTIYMHTALDNLYILTGNNSMK